MQQTSSRLRCTGLTFIHVADTPVPVPRTRRQTQRARRSRFQFHRLFHRAVGETLKQYALRLRLERAAARLAVGDETVLAIALSVGFASHEVFTRTFRRHFNMSPSQYRTRLLTNVPRLQRLRHLELTQAIGPCIRLFRYSPAAFNQSRRNLSMPVPSIVRKEISPQNVLFIRRRIARNELQEMLAECFGKLYTHSQKLGLPLAGFPLARYVSTARGLWTVEAAVLSPRQCRQRARWKRVFCREARSPSPYMRDGTRPSGKRTRRSSAGSKLMAFVSEVRHGNGTSPTRASIPIPLTGARRSTGRWKNSERKLNQTERRRRYSASNRRKDDLL